MSKNQLAGKIGVVIDLVTRLPVEIWFQEDAKTSDMKFESDILKLVKPQTLILLDRGFCHYQFWQQLITSNVHLITRLINKASFTVESILTNSYSIRDRIVKMGAGTKKTPSITMRLVEIRVGKTLIIDPFPDRLSVPQGDRLSRDSPFFFEPSAQTCLTTALVS